MSDDTVAPWLREMRAITGTKEVAGAGNNSTILGWAHEIGQRYPVLSAYSRQYTADATAWCGLACAFAVTRAGYQPPDGYLWARSWATWGESCEPRQGAILVFSRDGGGHVGICEEVRATSFLVRGGNQGDAVSVASYPKNRLLAARWPRSVIAQPQATAGRWRVKATEFGGVGDQQASAYGGMVDPRKLGVALPARLPVGQRRVRVYYGTRSISAAVVDVGPWNTSDPYWDRLGTRPQAETGLDRFGRVTNGAGIDLTPAAMDLLGIPGVVGKRSAMVEWTWDAPVVRPARPPEGGAVAGGAVAGGAAAGGVVAAGTQQGWPLRVWAAVGTVGAVALIAWLIWRWRRRHQVIDAEVVAEPEPLSQIAPPPIERHIVVAPPPEPMPDPVSASEPRSPKPRRKRQRKPAATVEVVPLPTRSPRVRKYTTRTESAPQRAVKRKDQANG